MGNASCRSTGSCSGDRRSSRKKWQPSELYDSCLWDEKTVRKMITRGKLAPSLHGKDCRETGKEHHCPICLHHYDEINMLKCCKATICTECYLQVQEPVYQSTKCPFCKYSEMKIVPTKQLNLSEAAKRESDEQKVIEATILARKNSESMTIKLPTEQLNNNYSDSSQTGSYIDDTIAVSFSSAPAAHNSSYTSSSMSTPNSSTSYGIRTYDMSDMIENRYQSSYSEVPPFRRPFYDLSDSLEDNSYEPHSVDQIFNIDDTLFYENENTSTRRDVSGLSEESQVALAIQMSLGNG